MWNGILTLSPYNVRVGGTVKYNSKGPFSKDFVLKKVNHLESEFTQSLY